MENTIIENNEITVNEIEKRVKHLFHSYKIQKAKKAILDKTLVEMDKFCNLHPDYYLELQKSIHYDHKMTKQRLDHISNEYFDQMLNLKKELLQNCNDQIVKFANSQHYDQLFLESAETHLEYNDYDELEYTIFLLKSDLTNQ